MTPMPANTTPAKLPPFKAVLWDMDGTLVHSDPMHAICVRKSCEEMGFSISDEMIWRALGVSHRFAYDFLATEFGPLPWSFEQFVQRASELYINVVAQVEPRGNVVDILRSLNQRGIKQAIFSNNPRLFIDATTKGLLRFFDNPAEIFETVISLDDVPAKPAPDGYLLAAQRLGVAPSECLVIEDSPTGIAAGLAAGCFSIYWPGPHDKPLKGQPHIIADNLDFLL